MVNSNKKQIIIYIIIICFMILIIGIYFLKSYFINNNYENIESFNILENDLNITNNSSDTYSDSKNTELNYIIIHITGAINNPGIVKLDVESRIADAINNAGGFTTDANVSAINLAYKLQDGEKIYIPSLNESSDIYKDDYYISSSPGENVISDSNSNFQTSSSAELININSATQTELETISGIGPSTALKIIQYRNENGKFNTIEDIKNVSGIGQAKFESIKQYIKVK